MNKAAFIPMIVLAFVLPVFVIISTLEFAIFDKGFFMREAAANNVSTNTGLSEEELSQVTDEIFKFLLGKRDDFNIEVQREDGRVTGLFTDEEMIHMHDVKVLFDAAVTAQIICGVIGLAMILLLYRFNKNCIVQGLFIGSLIGLGILLFLGLAATMDFTEVFELFHELIFTNDLWLLDPKTSVLINIVPEPYFIHLCLRTALYSAIVFGAMVIIYIINKRKMKESEIQA